VLIDFFVHVVHAVDVLWRRHLEEPQQPFVRREECPL
jgi:hypothetical protein